MWKVVLYLLFNLCNAYNAPQYTHNIAKDNFKLVPYFAKPIIRRNRLTRHQCDELIQEGYIGLMYAARKYDPDNSRKAKFVTYSSYWIKCYMHKYVKSTYTFELIPLREDIYVDEPPEKIIDYSALNKMEMEIIHRRYLQKPRSTARELATEYNITKNRVLAISNMALLKLKSDINKDRRL